MHHRRPWTWLFLLALTFSIVGGCATSFEPRPPEEINFRERSQTQTDGKFRVTAAVLSADETKAVFGFALYKKGVQPIWLEIENRDIKQTWFLPYSVDPDYFPLLEVTYPYHRTFNSRYNDMIDRHFLKQAMGLHLPPGSVRSGFVFTNLDLGTKNFNVDLVGEDNQPHTFTFFIPVPGLRSDHQDVDFDKLYSAAEIQSYTADEFRNAIKELPCCLTNEDGSQLGAPINLVIVADGLDLLRVLIRSGWNETAAAHGESLSIKTIADEIPVDMRYKPVEPLYYYGRQQDASFREPRVGQFERNKLRLWLSPMRVEGQEVWLGQVSRDFGEHSGKAGHKLDLDEVRSFLLQNLWYAQGIKKYGFVKGDGAVSSIAQPKTTFRGMTYITDGYRVVMWLSPETVPLTDVEFVDWEHPPER